MRYFIRSVKYFFAACVLTLALLAAMQATGTSALAQLSWREMWQVVFCTPRYARLLAALAVLAAGYPWFGFVQRHVEGELAADREAVEAAFRAAGFSLRGESEGELLFRADGALQRLLMLGEDAVRVRQQGAWIVLDGNRRGVARIAYRLDSYIQMKR